MPLRPRIAAALAALALACAPADDAAVPEAARTASGEPRVVADAPVPGERVRILVYHDMEGVAGQDDWRTFLYGQQEYARGREMLTADMNAVIDGLFAGGATEVHVVDAHGSTSPEPDLLWDRVDGRAVQVTRDTAFDAYMLAEPDAYDGVAAVAMHARTGSRGFASHTITIGMQVFFNGLDVSETDIIGYSWGRYDVPVIFASGDDRLGSDLESMPWLEYVTVKTATSASTVDLKPVEQAHAELRAGAQRAVERLRAGEMKTMRLTEPVRAALHTVPPARLAALDGVPGVEYDDETVTFTAPTYGAAYAGIGALIGVANLAYSDVLMERLAAHPAGPELQAQFIPAVAERWLDVESGRYTPPESQPARRAEYHGAN